MRPPPRGVKRLQRHCESSSVSDRRCGPERAGRGGRFPSSGGIADDWRRPRSPFRAALHGRRTHQAAARRAPASIRASSSSASFSSRSRTSPNMAVRSRCCWRPRSVRKGIRRCTQAGGPFPGRTKGTAGWPTALGEPSPSRGAAGAGTARRRSRATLPCGSGVVALPVECCCSRGGGYRGHSRGNRPPEGVACGTPSTDHVRRRRARRRHHPAFRRRTVPADLVQQEAAADRALEAERGSRRDRGG
jgi:hypothetical protein